MGSRIVTKAGFDMLISRRRNMKNRIINVFCFSLIFVCGTCHLLTMAYAASSTETEEQQRKRLNREYANIPKISADQAYALFCTGKIIIVDANAALRFKGIHCFGAINIPKAIAGRVKLRIPKKTLLGVY